MHSALTAAFTARQQKREGEGSGVLWDFGTLP
jgi:hypothetical protein